MKEVHRVRMLPIHTKKKGFECFQHTTTHGTVTDDYPDGPASWRPIQGSPSGQAGPRCPLLALRAEPGDVRGSVHLIAGDMDRLLKKVHWPHGIRHMPGDFFIGSFSSFCAKSRRPGCSVHEAHQEEGTLEKKNL